jgi:protein tyrosine phosphatase (PTP) superfamily phosphohydrolase (DUF442 family)
VILSKRIYALSCLALLPLTVPAQEAGEHQSSDLPYYLELTPMIGTGGQPSNAGFRLLADKGYRAVINLRTADEKLNPASEDKVNLEAEGKAVTNLGMKYISIPVSGKQPGDEQAAAFLKVMEEFKQDKVFVHCATGNRVGSLVLIKRVLQDGIGQEKGEEEARKAGLRSEVLLKFARDYISHQAGQK